MKKLPSKSPALLGLNFFILSFSLVNGSQAVYANPGLANAAGCLKCISGLSFSLPSKNLSTTLFIFYCITALIALKQNIT